MTKQEVINRIEENKLKMIDFDLVYDKFYESPHIMGCVKLNGKWKIYKTDERSGHAYFIDEYDTEDAAYTDLYEYVLHQIKLENL